MSEFYCWGKPFEVREIQREQEMTRIAGTGRPSGKTALALAKLPPRCPQAVPKAG